MGHGRQQSSHKLFQLCTVQQPDLELKKLNQIKLFCSGVGATIAWWLRLPVGCHS